MPAKVENGYRQQAFIDFRLMHGKIGVRKIFSTLGKKYHRSPHTIKSWYSRFGWADRAEKKEKKLAAKLDIHVEDTLVDVRRRQLVLCRGAQSRFAQHLSQDKVEMTLPGVRGVMEHELILHGFNPNKPTLTLNLNASEMVRGIGAEDELTPEKIASVLDFLNRENRNAKTKAIARKSA